MALSTDTKGDCVLGPISIYPVPTVDNEGCDKNFPKLDVKIIQGDSKDELNIHFSKDGGETYYNEEEPRIAVRIPDAYGKNSGGSSSKGGKKGKGTNDRRKLVEKTLKQAQRKLFWCDGSAQLGQYCTTLSWELSENWCAEGLDCHDNKCYKETVELGHECGEGNFFWCKGSSRLWSYDETWGTYNCRSTDHECIDGQCVPPFAGWQYSYSLCN